MVSQLVHQNFAEMKAHWKKKKEILRQNDNFFSCIEAIFSFDENFSSFQCGTDDYEHREVSRKIKKQCGTICASH